VAPKKPGKVVPLASMAIPDAPSMRLEEQAKENVLNHPQIRTRIANEMERLQKAEAQGAITSNASVLKGPSMAKKSKTMPKDKGADNADATKTPTGKKRKSLPPWLTKKGK
jgi:hypothetical protein